MADDDEERGSAPDPWDEIVAEGLGDFGDETVRFDEPVGEGVKPVEVTADGDVVERGMDVPAADPDPERGDAAESSIEDWLSGDDGDASAESPVLSVFVPEETATGLSDIAIGTGTSGISEPGDPEQLEDPVGDAFPVESRVDDATNGFRDGGEPESVADTAAGTDMSFAPAAAGTAAAAMPATGRRPRKSPGKSGGSGRLVGIVAGGVLAIPVTLATLMFGLGQDPLGLASLVPSSLLPATLQPPRPPAAVAVAPAAPAAVDEVPAEPEPAMPAPGAPDPADPVADEAAIVAAEMPAATSDADAGAAIPAEPAPVGETALKAADASAAIAVEPEPMVEPEPQAMPSPEPMREAAPPVAAVAVAADPGLDALFAEPAAVPPPAPQPPPVATAALDEAVAEAATLCEALGAVDDRENRAYTLLRTRWYQSLARVAEELVALEHAAVASGRARAVAPDNVALLHDAIVGREALASELSTLAPDWLSYAKRGSDGVVLPVTFDSARKVGPFWTARATLTDGAGRPRGLTLISRLEPAAVAGDRIVVTGVALEDGVIWAADLRPVAAGGDTAPGP